MVGRALPPLPGEDPAAILVDFLLPTSVIIPMQCRPRATLREIKEQLYREAKNYPLFSLLKDQGFYNFMGEARGEIGRQNGSVKKYRWCMSWTRTYMYIVHGQKPIMSSLCAPYMNMYVFKGCDLAA